jgi:hypothetical protein
MISQTAEETYKVEPLQGTNFRIEKFSMRMVSQARDLWSMVSGEEMKVSPGAKIMGNEGKVWERSFRERMSMHSVCIIWSHEAGVSYSFEDKRCPGWSIYWS